MSGARHTGAERPSQDAFVSSRRGRWDQLDTLLLGSAKPLHQMSPDMISTVGRLYRVVCADLMRARAAGYGRDVVEHLDRLAARAHNRLYRTPPYQFRRIWTLLARTFPQTLRESWRFLLAAGAAFCVPLVIGLLATLASPELAAEVVPKGQLDMLAQSYAEGFEHGRSQGTDTAMAGFYVNNNIGISFRVFATGIFFGLGSLFFLVTNGVSIGATIGYVSSAGAGGNILTFVMGHGAFELTAIVIAGAAGLRMGYALVRTDGRSRIASLRRQGPAVAQLVLGATVMLAIAALIEGYWSSSSVPDVVKWGVASVLWVAVLAYFVFAGRRETATVRAQTKEVQGAS